MSLTSPVRPTVPIPLTLRLSGDPDMTIHQITALTTPPPFEVKREWLDLSNGRFRGHSNPSSVKHSASVSPLYITYDAGGFFPVDALQLISGKKTALSRLRFTPAQKIMKCGIIGVADSFIPPGGGYGSDQQNIEMPGSIPSFLAHGGYPGWCRSAKRPGSWRSAPLLQIGWRPHDLIFLAQGEAPYVLAWGSGKLKAAKAHHLLSPSSASNMILQTLADRSAIDTQSEEGMVRRVIPGEHIILGGEQALQLRHHRSPGKSGCCGDPRCRCHTCCCNDVEAGTSDPSDGFIVLYRKVLMKAFRKHPLTIEIVKRRIKHTPNTW